MIISCPNLSNKEVAEQFNELVQAVGEKAAYQIWSLNNGNEIDKAPNGADSILFQQLLDKYDGNRLAAIKDKAITFADNFIKGSQDENGEVLLQDLYSGIRKSADGNTNQRLISNDYDNYVNSNVLFYIKQNKDASGPEIMQKTHDFSKQWAEAKQREIIGETQKRLMDAFGIVKTKDGFEIPGDNSKIAKLRIQFVTNMQESGYIDTYKKNEIDHYIISIGMLQGDATTFNHELAHYYIRTFKNSDLVQSALDMYAKKGMSIDEIEEALVDAITEKTINNQFGQNLENQSFFHKFWYGFNNLLYKIFKIKSKPVVDIITDQIAKSFVVNEQLRQTENDQKYQLSYDRMYQSQYKSKIQENETSSYKSRLNDETDITVGKIINSSKSKEKSFSQRVRRNADSSVYTIEQSIRNKELARKAKIFREYLEEASKSKNISGERKAIAKMYYLFLENAEKEAHFMRVMMLNAKANHFKKVYFVNNPDGTVRYTDPQDDSYLTESSTDPDLQMHDYTYDDLEYAMTDILGYYRPIIQRIRRELDSMVAQGYDDKDVNKIKDFLNNSDLERYMDDINNTYQDALEKKVKNTIDQIVDDRVELDADRRERLRINMHKWLRDQMDYGDVKIAEVVLGMGTKSKSPIIRAVQDIIDTMEIEKSDETYKIGKELDMLRRKAESSMGKKYKYFYNVQKLLMQLDRNGLPTGNLIQRINRGVFNKDRDEFRDQLLFGISSNPDWKFNKKSIEQQIKELKDSSGKNLVDEKWELTIDNNGNLILPDLQNNTQVQQIYKNYLREYEKWMCEYTDRQYTEKYYMDRIDVLSIPTLLALNRINDDINEIKSSCIVDGKPRYELLTREQINAINELEEQRSELGNFYDVDNNMKSGEAWHIAYDLMVWNRKTSDKLFYKTDVDLYHDCRDKAKDKSFFTRMFSSVQINPRIWDILKDGKISKIPKDDPDYKNLMTCYYQKSKLLSKYKGEKIGEIKWDELFDESTGRLKQINFWKVIHDIDEKINNLQTKLYNKYGKSKYNDQAIKFKEILKNESIPYYYLKRAGVAFNDPNEQSYYSYIIDALSEASKNAATKQEQEDIIKESNLLSYWNSALGMYTPTSIFSTLIPLQDKITLDNGEVIDTLIRQPNGLFRQLDVQKSSSEYVNKSYVQSEDGKVQPKESKYRDERFDLVDPTSDKYNEDLAKFYNKLVEVYEKAWKNLPILSKYDGRLSQMGAYTGQILGRKMKSQFGKNILEVLRREFSVVETDTEFRPVEDKEKRPDGTDIENVPIRFLRRLDNPEYINSDLVWSTLCFYDMSLNFKLKMNHLSELVSIFRRLDANSLADEYKGMFETKQADVLKGMLDRQMYDKQISTARSLQDTFNVQGQSTGTDKSLLKTGPGWAKRIVGSSKDQLKRIGKLRIMLQLGMLALNLPSAIVSFVDPFISLVVDSITGKYINAKDVSFALLELVKDFPTAVFGISNTKAYCKSVAAMQKMQLSKRATSTFKYTDSSPAIRFIKDGFLMKGFSLGDYTMNTINMVATMHNYKYYKDSEGTAAFYPKHIFIQKVMQDKNCDADLARNQYNNSVCLYDCYKINSDGEFVADINGDNKDFAKAIDPKLEMSIKKQVRSRSSMYNGIVPDSERTLLQTNVILAFVSMLRNFLITGIWERFQTYRDFQISTFDENGNIVERESTSEERAQAKKNQNFYKGGYSFATRQIENGVTTSAFYGLKHTSAYLKYAYFIAKNKNLTKYSTETQDYLKSNNLNQQDVYGLQKLLLECFVWISLMTVSPFLQNAADDDRNDYIIQLINLLTLRLAIERYTWYSPTTAMEIIKSPTTALSDWERKLKIFALGEDLVTYLAMQSGIIENNGDEYVKRGYYKNEPVWKRDLYSVLSMTGIHNWYKSMPESLGGGGARTIRETTNFYKSLKPDLAIWLEDKILGDDDDSWQDSW